jgi:hypothetical protein
VVSRLTRKESTDAAEQLSNAVVHNRALDEVARGVAQEHQWGRTTALAATGVAGVGAGVVCCCRGCRGRRRRTATGISVGGLAGAIIGGVLSSETGGWGAIPGLLGGSIAGGAAFGMAGAAAGALIGGPAGGIGFLFSDSRGDRSIVSDDRQNIMDMTVQKSSFSRSLRSTIMLDDFQQEKTNAKTFNVTNYNHSHALNLTYFEILHALPCFPSN